SRSERWSCDRVRAPRSPKLNAMERCQAPSQSKNESSSFRSRIHPRLFVNGWRLLLAALLLSSSAGQAVAQTQKTNFFLPQNPVAAAYVLGRLSNQELIAAPRSEFVYVALLQRAGLDRKYRLEALQGLATIGHTNPLSELLRTLSELEKKGETTHD